MDDPSIPKAPAPWKCKAQIYTVFFYTSAGKEQKDVPAIAYSPLEAESYFASPEAGKFVGGLGSIMIVRYSDTPVGPYDELAVLPGDFTYRVKDKGQWVDKKGLRVTRIYVSQTHTMFNGRYNWNIPKHLARFEWKDLPDGSTQVKVYPNDTTEDKTEAQSSKVPLFQASFKKIPYIPAFPLSTDWFKYLGINMELIQPPCPQGVPKEAVGTEKWCKTPLTQYSPSTNLGWFDMSQRDESGKFSGLFENFWPGLRRWQLGTRMDDMTFDIREGQYWDVPAPEPHL